MPSNALPSFEFHTIAAILYFGGRRRTHDPRRRHGEIFVDESMMAATRQVA
jgi:hypothetical protein